MARFPDQFFGTEDLNAAIDTVGSPDAARSVEAESAGYTGPMVYINRPRAEPDAVPNLAPLEIAKADSSYLIHTKQIRDRLAAESEHDALAQTYEPLFKQAYEDSAAHISDSRQRELWMFERAPDFGGNASAVSDRAAGLLRELEIGNAGAQLEAMRQSALETNDAASRTQFIRSANDLISGLQSAGHIDEAQAQERRKGWSEDFAVQAISRLPAAEQIQLLGGIPQDRASDSDGATASSKSALIDLVPQEKRSTLLQAAEINLRNEQNAAESASSLARYTTKTRIDGDLSSILKDGKGDDDLSFEHVQSQLGPGTAQKWQESRADHRAIWKHSSDLYALTEQQIEERMRSIAPLENELGDPRKAAIYYAVQEAANDVVRMRAIDPARSVENDPMVRAARERQEQGGDPQAQRDLYVARLAAQTRAGIDPGAQSPITSEEGLALISPLQGIQPGQERDVLIHVGEIFNTAFGDDSARAFSYAVWAKQRDTDDVLAATNVLKALRLDETQQPEDVSQSTGYESTASNELRPRIGAVHVAGLMGAGKGRAAASAAAAAVWKFISDRLEKFRPRGVLRPDGLPELNEEQSAPSSANEKLNREPVTTDAVEDDTRKAPSVATGNQRYILGPNGERYVALTDGSDIFGEISKRISRATGLQTGSIRLPEGWHDPHTNKGIGEKHVDADHGVELRAAGYKDVAEFVREVASQYNEIYRSSSDPGVVLLVKRNGRAKISVIGLRIPETGDSYWDVLTAARYNDKYFRNKERLWRKKD